LADILRPGGGTSDGGVGIGALGSVCVVAVLEEVVAVVDALVAAAADAALPAAAEEPASWPGAETEVGAAESFAGREKLPGTPPAACATTGKPSMAGSTSAVARRRITRA
jgi:hypothetical protein